MNSTNTNPTKKRYWLLAAIIGLILGIAVTASIQIGAGNFIENHTNGLSLGLTTHLPEGETQFYTVHTDQTLYVTSNDGGDVVIDVWNGQTFLYTVDNDYRGTENLYLLSGETIGIREYNGQSMFITLSNIVPEPVVYNEEEIGTEVFTTTVSAESFTTSMGDLENGNYSFAAGETGSFELTVPEGNRTYIRIDSDADVGFTVNGDSGVRVVDSWGSHSYEDTWITSGEYIITISEYTHSEMDISVTIQEHSVVNEGPLQEGSFTLTESSMSEFSLSTNTGIIINVSSNEDVKIMVLGENGIIGTQDWYADGGVEELTLPAGNYTILIMDYASRAMEYQIEFGQATPNIQFWDDAETNI